MGWFIVLDGVRGPYTPHATIVFASQQAVKRE
jgi:hypothetical protein